MRAKKRKILFITPGYMTINNNYGGGIENLVKKYFEHNEKSKLFHITAYSAYGHNDIPDENSSYNLVEFRNIDISKKQNNLIRKAERLLQILFGRPCARLYIKEVIRQINNDNADYDLIIIENCENDLAYISKKIKTKTPIVLHLHNDYVNKKRKDAKKCIAFLTQVWGVSNFVRDQVNEINHDTKAITIYNATISKNNSRTDIPADEKYAIRKQYGISKQDYVFIYVGRIMPEKGVKELVDAYNNLYKEHKNTTLLIAGGARAVNKSSKYYDKIRKLASKNPSIKMLGQLHGEELHNLYEISDCQVIPSRWNEAFGLVALEGQQHGLLQVASNWGGLVEVVQGTNYIPINKCHKKEIKNKLIIALNTSWQKKPISNTIFSENNFTYKIDQAIHNLLKAKNNE